MIKLVIALSLSSFVFTPLQAKVLDNCTPWKAHFINEKNLIIGNITISPFNIFDLNLGNESTKVHRLINKLHIKTKQATIQKQLLFKTGETLNIDKIKETERYLRAQKYIKDAAIIPTELCDGNQVNLNVKTRDNWTLTPDISFGRSGGNNKFGFKVQEQNILGHGKDLRLGYSKQSERTSTKLSYRDNHLLGSHYKLRINLLNNSDGKGYDIDLGLPFYKSDSRYSWGLKSSHLTQTTPLYENAIIDQEVNEKKQLHSLYYGWAGKQTNTLKQRFKVGWSFKKNNYKSLTQAFKTTEHVESYPWFEANFFGTRFIKKTNFNTMGKVEDIALAKNITLGIGLLLKEFGSADNTLKLTTRYSKGFQLTQSLLSFIELKTDNYLGNGARKGSDYQLKGELNHFRSTGNDIRIKAIFRASDHLTPSERIYLGGDTGMRGFPKAFQTGDKSFHLQAEKRLHFEWYPLHLVKFGAVAFSDIGSAWGRSKDPKLLANIGIGLRMIPTRASSSKTMHLNLAIPLTQRQTVDKFQISISTAKSF